MWDRQVPELAKHWRIFRFDLPGHGGAPAYPAGSVAEVVEAVKLVRLARSQSD